MTLNTSTKLACAALAIACTLGTVSVPAQAEPVEFGYRTSELADAGRLLTRIQRAAGRACRDNSSLARGSAERECRAAFEAEIVAQIGDSRLAAVARGRPAALASASR